MILIDLIHSPISTQVECVGNNSLLCDANAVVLVT